MMLACRWRHIKTLLAASALIKHSLIANQRFVSRSLPLQTPGQLTQQSSKPSNRQYKVVEKFDEVNMEILDGGVELCHLLSQEQHQAYTKTSILFQFNHHWGCRRLHCFTLNYIFFGNFRHISVPCSVYAGKISRVVYLRRLACCSVWKDTIWERNVVGWNVEASTWCLRWAPWFSCPPGRPGAAPEPPGGCLGPYKTKKVLERKK